VLAALPLTGLSTEYLAGDALAARLKEHHIPWLREPKDEGWGIEAFVTDPDGYQWAIVAPSHHGRWWVWPLNRLVAF